MSQLAELGNLWQSIQAWLFPMLEDELGELDEKHREFVAVCETCAPRAHLAAYRWVGNGCPPKDRLALCKAFIAKAVWDFPTTSALIDAARHRPTLRRLCGWEMLADPRITYLDKSRGHDGRSLRWMPGLDATVDGLMLMGHHAKAGTPGAFLPHTWTLEWSDFRINGQSVGEIGIEACFAGHWGVPLVLAQGDAAMCEEVRAQFPAALTACVKRAMAPDRCTGPDAQEARRLTAASVDEAVRMVRDTRPAPYKPALPMRVAIRMDCEAAADAAAQKPGVRRTDACTVECQVPRQCDVVKWINGTGVA
ncbi:MAG TPA: M55 family metallopeptidase [Phycisphaerae bacterium]|nr:M55 family metallopeptidase [Phycisphaerae bacterium]